MTRQPTDDADAGAAAAADDEAALPGKLRAQSGPRTTAPMWPRPLMTEGEWTVYTALWSFSNWTGLEAIPSYQKIADRAWCERGTAMNAVAKFLRLGLLAKEPRRRNDRSRKSNEYVLVEVCPDALLPRVMELAEIRIAEQATKAEKRAAEKRAYKKRKAGRDASPAETTASEDAAEGGIGGGSLHSDPPAGASGTLTGDNGGSPEDDPRGSLHSDPRGSSANDPLTYPVVDLSLIDQSPLTAVTTHAANAPASTDDEPPAELAADASAPSPVPAVGGKFSPEDQDQLTTAVDAAVAARKTRTGWPRPAVVAAVSEALDAGHPVAVVVAGLAEITKDRATDYPARLAPFLAAQAKRAGTSAPAEPYRHQPAPPCGPDCRCYKHPGPTSGISENAAAAIAAARAILPPGKPLSRSGSRVPTQPTGNAGTAASGDVSTESADAMADA